MTGIAREFPLTVRRANAVYHLDLCGLLQVRMRMGGEGGWERGRRGEEGGGE